MHIVQYTICRMRCDLMMFCGQSHTTLLWYLTFNSKVPTTYKCALSHLLLRVHPRWMHPVRHAGILLTVAIVSETQQWRHVMSLLIWHDLKCTLLHTSTRKNTLWCWPLLWRVSTGRVHAALTVRRSHVVLTPRGTHVPLHPHDMVRSED